MRNLCTSDTLAKPAEMLAAAHQLSIADNLAAGYGELIATSVGIRSYEELLQTFFKPPIKQHELRFLLPSAFDVTTDQGFCWLYQPEDFSWDNLSTPLQSTEVKTAVLLAPFAWQLGPLFYAKTQKHGVTAAVFDDANPTSAALVMQHHPVELLVTTSRGLQALMEACASDQQLPRTIMVIEPFGDVPFLLGPEGSEVMYDLQLFPGFSIAGTPAPHVPGESLVCTPNAEYLFEIENDRAFVTSLTKTAVPFVRFPLPGKIAMRDSTQFSYV